MAPRAAGAPPRWRPSLRAKGLIALVAVAAYTAGMLAYVQSERAKVLRDVAAMEGLRESEEALTRAGIALSDSLFIVHRRVGAGASALEELGPELEELEGALKRAARAEPPLAARLAEVKSALADYLRSRALVDLYGLRAALITTAGDVDRAAYSVRGQRVKLNAEVRETYDRISQRALLLGAAGLALFGMVSTIFFARLSAQLEDLKVRAGAIVRGYRGAPLASRRRDEVGELSNAVDRMAADLGERERRLELGLARQAHAERMGAVGAMAAKVAHEIGNPLAVISGLAQEIGAAAPGALAGQARAIVEQSERIAVIARRMTELAAARQAQPGTSLDLNAAAEAAAELVRFDPRLGHQRLLLETAAGLPAGKGDWGNVVHLLVSLLLAAVDELASEERGAALRLATGCEGDRLFARVALDAPGGAAPARAFADRERIALAGRLAAEMDGKVELHADPPGAVLWLQADLKGKG